MGRADSDTSLDDSSYLLLTAVNTRYFYRAGSTLNCAGAGGAEMDTSGGTAGNGGTADCPGVGNVEREDALRDQKRRALVPAIQVLYKVLPEFMLAKYRTQGAQTLRVSPGEFAELLATLKASTQTLPKLSRTLSEHFVGVLRYGKG